MAHLQQVAHRDSSFELLYWDCTAPLQSRHLNDKTHLDRRPCYSILPYHLIHILKWIRFCFPASANVNADISCTCVVWWLKHTVCRCVRPIKHEQWCELPVRGFQVIDFPTCSSAENRIFNLSLSVLILFFLVKCDRWNVFIFQPRNSTFSLVVVFKFFRRLVICALILH